VISDGQSVVLDNKKMNTMDLYPLSKTPLKLLLDERIDLSGNKVRSVKEEDDLTTIQLADKSVFGNSRITMMFDPKSYDLRQWTITDAQGKDTTVMIFNVRQGVKIDQDLFKIDYKRNIDLNKNKNSSR
jgi:outer membrane lipoprotein-sorting protein